MDWTQALFSGVVLVVLLAPIALLAIAVLGLLMSQFFTAPAGVSRVSFDCPFSRRKVSAAFESRPGVEHPENVLACSAFPEGRKVACRKECLAIAESRWAPSPMVPRFSVIAGGVAPR